ncbi:hypothetical protein HDU97_007837 [Phlyctochytrium planicorne]|nr:hypothetical protein HDU97_007837 [Phlyctochytrium planicorne]
MLQHPPPDDDGNGGFFRLKNSGTGASRYVSPETIIKVLSGYYKIWLPSTKLAFPSRLLRIFLSSTFTDTAEERDAIVKLMLDGSHGHSSWSSPTNLRDYSRERGIDIELVELRWGIHDSETKENLTWEICREELQRCYDQSMGLFFLSLVSHKYGYRSLPRLISTDTWRDIEKHAPALGNDGLRMLKELQKIYFLDENIVRDVPGANDDESLAASAWYRLLASDNSVDFESCRDFIAQVLALSNPEASAPKDIQGLSVTHWETRAALGTKEYGRMAWIHRSFNDSVAETLHTDPVYSKFVDYKNMMVDLTARSLLSHLHSELECCETKQSFEVSEPKPISDAFSRNLVKTVAASFHSLDQHERSRIQATHSPTFENIQISRRLETIDKNLERITDYHSRLSVESEAIHFVVRKVKDLLMREVDSSANTAEEWESNVQALEVSLDDVRDWFHHVEWARSKLETFFGREEMIESVADRVKAIIYDARSGSTRLKERCVALVGRSGCGKTSMMSKVAHHLSQLPDAPWVLVRFCGTNEMSGTAFDLLISLSAQLLVLYRHDASVHNDTALLADVDRLRHDLHNVEKYDRLVEVFHAILSKIPKRRRVVLMIDSLDQLSDANDARTRLGFLPKVMECDGNIVWVVSTIPDGRGGAEGLSNGAEGAFYGCSTRLEELGIAAIDVSSVGASEAKTILKRLLSMNGRRVRNSNGLLKAFEQAVQLTFAVSSGNGAEDGKEATSTPLFLTLLHKIAATFASHDVPNDLSFLSGTQPAIDYIFSKLELDLGQTLVSRTLAYITFSRNGVSEEELLDLLSADDAVLDSVFSYWTPPIRRMPRLPLCRIILALGAFIVRKNAGGLIQWYHRQFWERAEERWRNLEADTRERLVHYFVGQKWFFEAGIDKEGRRKRQIPNARRCHEASYHLSLLLLKRMRMDKAELLAKEVCCMEGVEARARLGDGNLLECPGYLRIVEKTVSAGDSGHAHAIEEMAKHYRLWLLQDAYRLEKNPSDLLYLASLQPSISKVHQHGVERSEKASLDLLPARSLTSPSNFPPIVGQFETKSMVWSIDVFPPYDTSSRSQSGSRAVAGLADGTVVIWDVHAGTSQTIEGHADMVTSLCPALGYRMLVTTSRDKTARIWDISKGIATMRFVAKLEEPEDIYSFEAYPVASNGDRGGGRYVMLLGSTLNTRNRPIFILDVVSKRVSKIEGFNANAWAVSEGTVMAVEVAGPGGVLKKEKSHLLAHGVSSSNEVMIRKLPDLKIVQKLRGHAGAIASVAFIPLFSDLVAGQSRKDLEAFTARVLTVAQDLSARVWSLKDGACIQVFDVGTCSGASPFSSPPPPTNSNFRSWIGNVVRRPTSVKQESVDQVLSSIVDRKGEKVLVLLYRVEETCSANPSSAVTTTFVLTLRECSILDGTILNSSEALIPLSKGNAYSKGSQNPHSSTVPKVATQAPSILEFKYFRRIRSFAVASIKMDINFIVTWDLSKWSEPAIDRFWKSTLAVLGGNGRRKGRPCLIGADATLYWEIVVKDLETGKLWRTLKGHTWHITGIRFLGLPRSEESDEVEADNDDSDSEEAAEEALMVTGSVDNTIRAWSIENALGDYEAAGIFDLSSSSGEILSETLQEFNCFSVFDDGLIVVGHRDGSLSACSSRSDNSSVKASRKKILSAHMFCIDVIVPRQSTASEPWFATACLGADQDKRVRVWDVRSWKCVKTLDHQNGIEKIGAVGSRLVTMDMGETVYLWEVKVEKEDVVLLATLHGQRLLSVWDEGGYMLLQDTNLPLTVGLWNVSAGERVWVVEGLSTTIDEVSFAQIPVGGRNSRFVACRYTGKGVRVLDVDMGAVVLDIVDLPSEAVSPIHFITFDQMLWASDGSQLLISRDGSQELQSWNILSKEMTWRFRPDSEGLGKSSNRIDLLAALKPQRILGTWDQVAVIKWKGKLHGVSFESFDGTNAFWHHPLGERVFSLQKIEGIGNGIWMAIRTESAVQLVEVCAGGRSRELRGKWMDLEVIASNSDSHIMYLLSDASVCRWDVN